MKFSIYWNRRVFVMVAWVYVYFINQFVQDQLNPIMLSFPYDGRLTQKAAMQNGLNCLAINPAVFKRIKRTKNGGVSYCTSSMVKNFDVPEFREKRAIQDYIVFFDSVPLSSPCDCNRYGLCTQ